MDRDVPPRVAYWTSSFRAEMEAVASEVACLRAAFPGSVAWGISGRDWARFSWKSGFCVPPKLALVFRGATWLLQQRFHINHIFGSLGDWFHLTATRKQPVVLTMAMAGEPCDARLLGKVDRFVAEWPAGRDQLQRLGIEAARMRLIFPPVDVARFAPSEAPAGPFTVLFASSPDDAEWLEARGVPLILEAASLRPQMRFRLVWRPWGNSRPCVERWIQERALKNVELLAGRIENMAECYRAGHVTVAPFTRLDRCKSAPNSLLESLASGRPVVMTAKVGLAELIHAGQAGLICGETGESLAAALDETQARWSTLSRRARELAEQRFSAERFVGSYAQLYEELL